MTQAQTPSSSRLEQRSRIIAAAAQLLGARGSSALTTRAVAEAAGVQAPTIFRLFGDKEGLLEAVAEHQLAIYFSSKWRADATGHPAEDLWLAFSRYIEFGLANPALFHLLADPDRAARSPAAAAGRRILTERVHRLAATGRLRASERSAVDLIHAAGTGVIITELARPASNRDPYLASTLLDVLLRYLLTHPPESLGRVPAEGRTTAAAVGLRAALPDLAALSAGERTLLAEWLDRIIASEELETAPLQLDGS